MPDSLLHPVPGKYRPTAVCCSIALVLLLLPRGMAAQTDPYPRDAAVDVIHYLFELEVSDTDDVLRGRTTVTIRFTRAGRTSFALDLIGPAPGNGSGQNDAAVTGMTVQEVRNAARALRFTHEADRLVIQLGSAARAGEDRTFTITYSGVPADGLIIARNRYGERTFFGDNWPDRARHWLPAVDHPSDKATCEFIVTAPAHYQVVGSGALVEETEVEGNRCRTHWRTSAPLATKLMVIGVASFAVVDLGDFNGIPQSSWTYPQDSAAGVESFAVSSRVMDFFSERIGPFAWAKMAHVQSKTRYGGMENASNIFYTEGRANRPASWSEGLVVHEMAHQWFGDAISEADWHHVWLSEGFATYFTTLYMEFTHGHDQLISRMAGDRERVVRYWHRNPNSPVLDTTIVNLNRLLSTNSYQKGSWVLHMLRHQVGEQAWWEGIRTYYERFMNGNALSADFQAVMEEVSGQDLGGFFNQWLRQPGHPVLQWSWEWDEDRHLLQVSVRQAQESGHSFTFPLEVGIGIDPSRPLEIAQVQMNAPLEVFVFEMDAAPLYLTLDPNVWLLMEAEYIRN